MPPMPWRACKRRWHEHRHPQARAGPASQLSRSSDTTSVCHARRCITADQCPRISAEHLAAERIRLGDALYRQEYFGAFVSAPGSVFDAEVLAHMFGDDIEEEPASPTSIVQGRVADRFLQ